MHITIIVIAICVTTTTYICVLDVSSTERGFVWNLHGQEEHEARLIELLEPQLLLTTARGRKTPGSNN